MKFLYYKHNNLAITKFGSFTLDKTYSMFQVGLKDTQYAILY